MAKSHDSNEQAPSAAGPLAATSLAHGKADREATLPTPSHLWGAMAQPLARIFGERSAAFSVELTRQPVSVPDATTVYTVRDGRGRPVAVVLSSPAIAPDKIEARMRRTRQVKAALGPLLGAVILDPLAVGHVDGLSYAIMPFCWPIGTRRPYWQIQRAILRPKMLAWLRGVIQRTAAPPPPGQVERTFIRPLEYLREFSAAPAELRRAADLALQRLRSGAWRPRHVLMHNDLWRGNILVARPVIHLRPWPGLRVRPIVIDWAGALESGYGLHDLTRLGMSLRLRGRRARREVAVHCRLLGCDTADAPCHLAAALGHVAMNLGYMPLQRYACTAQSCLDWLVALT